MEFLRSTSAPAKTALIYITVGTMTVIWTSVYFAYRYNNASDADPVPYYWIAGFMATGLALVTIGLATGQIGRAAKPAESEPPTMMAPATAATEGQLPTNENVPVVMSTAPPPVVVTTRPMQPNNVVQKVGV